MMRQDDAFVSHLVMLFPRKKNFRATQFDDEGIFVNDSFMPVAKFAVDFHAKAHKLKSFFFEKQFFHSSKFVKFVSEFVVQGKKTRVIIAATDVMNAAPKNSVMRKSRSLDSDDSMTTSTSKKQKILNSTNGMASSTAPMVCPPASPHGVTSTLRKMHMSTKNFIWPPHFISAKPRPEYSSDLDSSIIA